MPTRTGQLEFWPVTSPFAERFGLAFLRTVPVSPGVYFFHDENRRLLYIGKASNLRRRIGSYRFARTGHVPRRVVRLTRSVRHVNWDVMGTEEEARDRERALLKTLRPPFNVADTGPTMALYVSVRAASSGCEVSFFRERTRGTSIGPLALGWRYLILAAARLYHFSEGDRAIVGGLHRRLHTRPGSMPRSFRAPPGFGEVVEKLVSDTPATALGELMPAVSGASTRCAFEQRMIQADWETVEEFLELGTDSRHEF